MSIDIDRLTEAELIDLNHRIVARLKFLSQMRAHASMLNFSIGERVAFDPPNRPTRTSLAAITSGLRVPGGRTACCRAD